MKKTTELKIMKEVAREERIEELIKQLQQEKEKNKYLDNKLHSGIQEPDFKNWSQKVDKELVLYIETLAAKYSEMYNLNPSNVVLNVGLSDDGKVVKYWVNEDKSGSVVHQQKFL
jgi:hypothetical protein